METTQRTTGRDESREAAEQLFGCLTRLYAKTADPRQVACLVREMHDGMYEAVGIERSDAIMERATDLLAETVAHLTDDLVDREAGDTPLVALGQGDYARTIEEVQVRG